MTKSSVAIYPGTFDPPSFGHINIIERSLKVFDKVIVAVALSNAKASLFSADERKEMLTELFGNNPKIEIDTFEGLLVNYAQKRDCNTIIRGIRTVGDYEYEFQMSLANRMLDSEIETIFMMTEGRYSHISSSIVKQVIALGGSGKELLPKQIEERLRNKLL